MTENENKRSQNNLDINTLYTAIQSINNIKNILGKFSNNLRFKPPVGKQLTRKPLQPVFPLKPSPLKIKEFKSININQGLENLRTVLKNLLTSFFKFSRPKFIQPNHPRILVKRTFLSNRLIIVKPPGVSENSASNEKETSNLEETTEQKS